jgi:hypothetical protein
VTLELHRVPKVEAVSFSATLVTTKTVLALQPRMSQYIIFRYKFLLYFVTFIKMVYRLRDLDEFEGCVCTVVRLVSG